MATVACPGCGLPRVESELGVKPCPVCDAAPVAAAPRAKPKAAPDPTNGMPADVSELNAPGAPAATRALARPWLAYCAVAFLLGAVCGIGGVLGIQTLDQPEQKTEESEIAARPTDEPPVHGNDPLPPAPRPQSPEVAPMPHEPGAQAVVAEPQPDPEPEPNVKQIKAPLPGHIEIHEFNEPLETYSVPSLKKGEHVVLRSKEKIKALRVHILDAGAVLDASGVEAEVITVSGKIDGGSTLKLRSTPKGTIHIGGKIDGKSTVELVAPDGEVKFTAQTTPRNEGAKIDNGSKVAITARVVEFKGDIGGADTKVSVTLNRNAWLKVAAVGGTATVEYKSQMAGWSPPDVIVGPVAPGATFRKSE